VEEEFVDGDGTTKLRAKCLHPGCTSRFSLQKGGGNGHMKMHMKTHAKKDEQSAAIQSRIKFNPDGSKGIFVYDDRRQSLTLDMVKYLMTMKDGQLAKRRAQHSTHNDELVAAFESMRWSEEPKY
jgi:hypothetical protein